MNTVFKFGFASAWLAAAMAYGQAAPDGQPVRIELASGKLLSTSLANRPLRLPTLAGDLTFHPGELTQISFSADGQCVAQTIYGDDWRMPASPYILLDLVENSGLYGLWDQMAAVSFLAPSAIVEKAATAWKATLSNGSEILLRPRSAELTVERPDGKIDLPWPIVWSLNRMADQEQVRLEIAPGKFVLHALPLAGTFAAEDLGGRRLKLSWEDVREIVQTGREPTSSAKGRSSHVVTCRGFDGQEWRVASPVAILRIKGRGGDWTLPSTRILRARWNSDGTHAVQTTAGEWLSGKIDPPTLPLAETAAIGPLRLKDVPHLAWDNEHEEIPEGHGVWRLKSGDLMVGKWLNPPEESVALQRVTSQTAAPAAQLPMQSEGKWPVSRFEIEHWASGTTLKLSASDVEAVGLGPVAQMPPALVPDGPSAVCSDEILLPGGSFTMGRTRGDGPADEVPPVELSVAPFWLANTPVTVTQFAEFAVATKHVADSERTPGAATWRTPGFAQRPEAPVVCVSWRDAVRYCNWRSAKAGLKPCYDLGRPDEPVIFLPDRNGYRLSLEAEWEYAARSGGKDVVYPWGDEANEEEAAARANFSASGEPSDPWPWTNPVKTFPPSAGGFYDLAGNVWEWCQDVYRSDAYAAARRGEGLGNNLNAPLGLEVRRTMRGGSYHNGLEFLRCAARGHGLERMNASRVGFRVARNAEPLSP
ncbi:MAG: hypothetical protein EOL90_03690 [Spartobacteria bacterium]|nr:hypothetical protein [Spartobacteria bacterium]